MVAQISQAMDIAGVKIFFRMMPFSGFALIFEFSFLNKLTGRYVRQILFGRGN